MGNLAGMRYIRKETIRSWDEDGNLSEKTVWTIHIVQQKTDKKVAIPCSTQLKAILEKIMGKYDYFK